MEWGASGMIQNLSLVLSCGRKTRERQLILIHQSLKTRMRVCITLTHALEKNCLVKFRPSTADALIVYEEDTFQN